MAAKDTNEDAKPEDQDAGHSLDMSQAAVKKMIAEARERGYITYDQLNQVLPPEQVSSEQIEDVMSMLSEMGINVTQLLGDSGMPCFTSVMAKTRSSSSLTSDLKDLYVDKKGRMVPFLEILSDLIKRQVSVRLIHAKEPGKAFRDDCR